MSLIPVYYDVCRTAEGATVCVTDAFYFDAYGEVDDGDGSPNYDAIAEAMEACGCPALCESVHELAGEVEGNVQVLVDAMEAKGFELKTNPGFTRLVRNPATGG